jgi:ferredoxin--NADP+ reductase
MLNATLVRRVDFGDDLCVLRIRPDAGVPSFEPGQFVKLGLLARDPDGKPLEEVVKRAYSLASAPTDHDGLELYLVKVREGELTPEVWDLREGDRLFVEGKVQGEFTLEGVPTDHDVLAVATGTGIAPYVSMLRTFAGKQRWRRFTVVHGTRRLVDLGYREEIESYVRRYPDVRYVPILSREPEGSSWQGLRGRVLQLLEPAAYERVTGAPLDPSQTEVFLCGNPEMVQTARKTLEARGFVLNTRRRRGTIHMERYW